MFFCFIFVTVKQNAEQSLKMFREHISKHFYQLIENFCNYILNESLSKTVPKSSDDTSYDPKTDKKETINITSSPTSSPTVNIAQQINTANETNNTMKTEQKLPGSKIDLTTTTSPGYMSVPRLIIGIVVAMALIALSMFLQIR